MTQPAQTFPDIPRFAAIEQAAERIRGLAQVTPVFRSTSIDQLAGAELLFKCENLQRAGAFKFRGACNAVWSLPQAMASRGVVTHSSGNHGAALALAARTRGIPAHVVIPDGAVQSKIDAIEAYGATLHRCAPTLAAREQTAEAVRGQTGATLVHPYTDPAVIAGQGTAALEFLGQVPALDALIAPVGGGGLISGIGTECEQRRGVDLPSTTMSAGCNPCVRGTGDARRTHSRRWLFCGSRAPCSWTGRERR